MRLAVGLPALATGSALTFVWWREQRRIAALRERLFAPASSRPDGHADDPAACPPVVARYLKFALAGASFASHGVQIRQSGSLRADPTSRKWLPFRALHQVAVARPGFLWDAKVTLAPGIHVRVVDSFVDGAGAGKVLLQSIVPLAGKADTGPINAGSLHRLLAEAVWYPWLLFPGEHIAWRGVADDRAEATLTLEGTSVSLLFRFAATGEATGIFTPARWGSFSGRYLQLPWEGHFGEYVDHDGARVPSWGEVGWHHQGELQLVWQASVQAFRVLPKTGPASGSSPSRRESWRR